MASDKPIRVAIIGLGFGAEFIPIYQTHPGAEMYADLPASTEGPRRVRRPVRRSPSAYTDFEEVLKDPDVDAVHINTPIPDHAWQSRSPR